jgi:quinoprotein glucose dehydrogenase
MRAAGAKRAGKARLPSSPPMNPTRVLLLILLAAGLVTAALAAAQPPPVPRAGVAADWPAVNGDPGGSRYSLLDQINRENVGELEVAWTYRTGDADAARGTNIECTPVAADGVLYLTTCSPRVKVAALDAATGRELWKYDPFAAPARHPIASGGVNRGVAYWSDGQRKRVLLGTADGRLISLDARTGRPDPAFGSGGEVDLRAGIERDLSRLPYGCTSPPAVFEDLVILGFSNGEGPGPAAPGDVRAFDVRTGKEAWRFHTVPRPGEFGHETWEGDSWKERGGCNNWSGASVDTRHGLVFVATGSPAFDFYGGDRKGANLFGNCVLALDARIGKRRWHFQTVHHDLWDYDNPCPPVLCTVTHGGRRREAVAQVTKTGFCFVLDRLTGEPLFPVEERPVPKSDVPGEASWPTQPFPLKPPPLCRQAFGPEDVTDLSPAARAQVLERLKSMRYGPIFTPTGFQPTVRLPGFHGGASWAGASFDPTTGTLYVNTNDIPREHALERTPPGTPYPYRNTGYARFVDPDGYPAIKPPWGHLTAIDLNRGEFAWREVLGEYPELRAKGLPPTGTESLGGTIVTAGGLVFVGGTKDEKLRAFDKGTGKLLWEAKLPYAGYATPCTYLANGRQYVVIAAGGGGKPQTKSGDQFLAFALRSRIK